MNGHKAREIRAFASALVGRPYHEWDHSDRRFYREVKRQWLAVPRTARRITTEWIQRGIRKVRTAERRAL